MRDLLITLGHNASVVAIEDGHVLNAYEAERLTGVKSDSRFPIDALWRIKDMEGSTKFDRAFVGHWAPYNKVDDMKEKYWDRELLSQFATKIFSQEQLGMSHHDTHCHAAVAFAGDDFPKFDSGVLVIDGFGNFAEHISYYRLVDGKPLLVNRLFGYETSLGLMYQYATAFLGMKMHEDEYKLLGYGARVKEVVDDLGPLDEIAYRATKRWMGKIQDVPRTGIALDELPRVQADFNAQFSKWLEDAGYAGDVTHEGARRIVGYILQTTLENCVLNYVRKVGAVGNLIFTGGVAFNVALNRMLLRTIRGKLCAYPLAGDQGNGFGMATNMGHKIDFGDLCWGKRSTVATSDLPAGLVVYENEQDAVQLAKDQIEVNGFVNVVRGRMEYGPRALCNTSTLAKADSMKVVDEINRINGRNTVMPFAPVVWHRHAEKVFIDIERLHRSEKFMICATDYEPKYGDNFVGARLKTARGNLTGRPQVYHSKGEVDLVADVLKDHGLVINTSFNVHGVPICCDFKDVVHSHQYQRERNPNVHTIFIKEPA